MQGSGDENALGILKFNFPNKYAVYLHDTNQRYLFSRTVRSLSHGCVRVQEWEELAYNIIRYDNKDNYKMKHSPVEDSLDRLAGTKRKTHHSCSEKTTCIYPVFYLRRERWQTICFMMIFMEKIKPSRKNSLQANKAFCSCICALIS